METNTNIPFSTGAIPSPEDYRDVPLAAVAVIPTLTGKYFEPVDDLPVWNQRKIGACVGHAGAKYKQHLDKLETGKYGKHSARFLYALAKCRDGYAGEGTYPRLVAQIIKDHGVATEDTVPNDTTLAHEAYVYNRNEANIPKEAWDDAKKYKISGYAFPNVRNKDELGASIKQFHGSMLLMRIGEEWWKRKDGVSSWQSKDIVPLRAPKNIVSGHEVYLYGYEVEAGTGRVKFYIFNSWSTDWGISGKAWFYHDEYVSFLDEAITFVDLPNEVAELLNQLPTKETFKHKFVTPIKFGDRGEEVKALQTALMIDGTFDKTLFKSLWETKELGYYGLTTAKAVYEYQKKYAVAPSSTLLLLQGKNSTVGPKTREKLTAQFG